MCPPTKSYIVMHIHVHALLTMQMSEVQSALFIVIEVARMVKNRICMKIIYTVHVTNCRLIFNALWNLINLTRSDYSEDFFNFRLLRSQFSEVLLY